MTDPEDRALDALGDAAARGAERQQMSASRQRIAQLMAYQGKPRREMPFRIDKWDNEANAWIAMGHSLNKPAATKLAQAVGGRCRITCRRPNVIVR